MLFLPSVAGDIGDFYGVYTSPKHGVSAAVKAGKPWAAELGAAEQNGYSFVTKAQPFDEIFSWLDAMRPYRAQCMFLAGLDSVGNATETLEMYEEYSRYFLSDGWPMAYIAQNGAESLPIPGSASALHVAGVSIDGRFFRRAKDYRGALHVMDWKETPEAVSVIVRAQQMGKHIHIGRVNHRRKYDLFRLLRGSENFTCDGTRQRKDGKENTLRAWQGYQNNPQPHLFRI